MAQTLTSQVRSIAIVTQAVRFGDFTQMIEVECEGEILVLKETVNGMIDGLNEVVTGVASLGHNVAVEGALGGQAMQEKTLQGMWKTMVDNTNAMANSTYFPSNILLFPTSPLTGCLMGSPNILRKAMNYAS
jgi:osomolarity two-component system sensor histidine kinase NIK1